MRIETLNGLSRVNIDPKLNGLSRVNLNGYSLNGYQLNAYLNYCKRNRIDPAMNGAFATFLSKVAPKVKGGITKIVDRIKENKANRDFVEMYKNTPDAIEETEFLPDVDTRGLFDAPSLFKEPGKWFASDRVPTMQKVGVVAAGVVLIDALTGGNIILQRVGIMKPKTKRK